MTYITAAFFKLLTIFSTTVENYSKKNKYLFYQWKGSKKSFHKVFQMNMCLHLKYNIIIMGLDIKIPIGGMFTILGIILTVFGLTTNGSDMYDTSLNININLWSGLFMLIFGVSMLLAAFMSKKKKS